MNPNDSDSSTKTSSTRRGGILIEPYKQLRFGLTFLVINLIFSLLFFTVFGYFLWDIYQSMAVYFKLDDSQSLITMAKIGKPALVGLILIIFFIGTTLFMSAKYTHQIYGPLVSIHRFLDEVLGGEIPKKINLRSSDQLQELAGKLNEMALKLSEAQQSSSKKSKKLPNKLEILLDQSDNQDKS